ncbi:MAG TPA: c-type cytochrome [Flavobacteriales bacterium]|nr:c-type cytochrome [Flavobacteriales bacterium]
MNTFWKTTLTIVLIGGLLACGGGNKPAHPPGTNAGTQVTDASTSEPSPKATGLITAADLQLGEEVDAAMAEKGKTTYDVKCQACHSTGANRVVGPGWQGLATKREPAWIMNMIMNIDVMLESDPEAQKLLEECLVRMPNQNLSKDEAREVLEFMRTL